MVKFRDHGVPSPAAERGPERRRPEPVRTMEQQVVRVPKPFKFLTDTEIENLEPPDWLVPQMLHVGSLGVLFGPPGTGKSFIALDWAFRIATGLPWLTGSVRQGAVIYVAAEQPGQHRDRVRAWKQANGIIDNAGVLFVPMAVDLSDAQEVEDFLAALPDGATTPELIVIDTLARSMIGLEENSAKDMGLFIAGADRIREATGAAVLFVHHGDGKTRGSTALPGASDVMIGVAETKPRSGRLRLRCHKQKSAVEFDDLCVSRLPFGESCIIIGDETNTAEPATARDVVVKKGEGEMLSALRDGTALSATEWCRRSSVPKSSFYRHLKVIVKAKWVAKETGESLDGEAVDLYRLTSDGESHAQTGSK